MRLREKGANKSAVWATGAQPRQGIPGAGVAYISVVAHGASQSSTFSSQSWVEGRQIKPQISGEVLTSVATVPQPYLLELVF